MNVILYPFLDIKEQNLNLTVPLLFTVEEQKTCLAFKKPTCGSQWALRVWALSSTVEFNRWHPLYHSLTDSGTSTAISKYVIMIFIKFQLLGFIVVIFSNGLLWLMVCQHFHQTVIVKRRVLILAVHYPRLKIGQQFLSTELILKMYQVECQMELAFTFPVSIFRMLWLSFHPTSRTLNHDHICFCLK